MCSNFSITIQCIYNVHTCNSIQRSCSHICEACFTHSFFLFRTSFPTRQNDEKVKGVINKSKGHPRHRLQHIYDLAKVKSVCEGGDTMDTKFDPTAEPGEPKVVRL